MSKTGVKNIICEIILTVYIVLVIYLNSVRIPNSIFSLILVSCCIGYSIHVLMPYICSFKINRAEKSVKNSTVFILSFGICLIMLTFSWFSYRSGGMNLDALGQWDQAQHGGFNDWHPVICTLFIYAVTRIHNDFVFYIFVQILLFSISIGYLSIAVNKLKVPTYCLIMLVLYVSINPATHYIMLCMYKDSIFSIFVIFLIGQLLNIYRTDGVWLNSILNCAAFVTVIVLVTFIRHNGIFITLPVILLLLLLYHKSWKRLFFLSFTCIIICVLIKGPLYSKLDVIKHENISGELMGVPMAILANELINSPQTVDSETHRFLNTIASDDEWNKYYITGEWDSIKWYFGGTELLKDTNPVNILKYTAKSIKRNPQSAFVSFANNTKVAFQIAGTAYWNDKPYIEDNEYGIKLSQDNLMRKTLDFVADLTSKAGLSTLFWNIGLYNLLIIILLISRIIKRNYKTLIFTLPIILYNIATAFILSGPSYRYFYFNVPIFFALTTGLLYDNNE